jgi:hypothetical protein
MKQRNAGRPARQVAPAKSCSAPRSAQGAKPASSRPPPPSPDAVLRLAQELGVLVGRLLAAEAIRGDNPPSTPTKRKKI